MVDASDLSEAVAVVSDSVAALTGQLAAIVDRLDAISGTLSSWNSEVGVVEGGKVTSYRVNGLSISIDNDFSGRRCGDY